MDLFIILFMNIQIQIDMREKDLLKKMEYLIQTHENFKDIKIKVYKSKKPYLELCDLWGKKNPPGYWEDSSNFKLFF